jgi:hypothetical protein
MSSFEAAEACAYCEEEPPGSTTYQLSPRLPARISPSKRQRPEPQRDLFVPGGIPGRMPRSTSQTKVFRKTFYPDIADKEWNSWYWQARNRIRTLHQLEQLLELSKDERAALSQASSMLPVSITPY